MPTFQQADDDEMQMRQAHHGLSIEQFVELRDFITRVSGGIMPDRLFTNTDTAIMLHQFADKYDLSAMYRFLVKAKRDGQSEVWIMAQLSHDLAGRHEDPAIFSPRTSSY